MLNIWLFFISIISAAFLIKETNIKLTTEPRDDKMVVTAKLSSNISPRNRKLGLYLEKVTMGKDMRKPMFDIFEDIKTTRIAEIKCELIEKDTFKGTFERKLLEKNAEYLFNLQSDGKEIPYDVKWRNDGINLVKDSYTSQYEIYSNVLMSVIGLSSSIIILIIFIYYRQVMVKSYTERLAEIQSIVAEEGLEG